MNTAKYLWSRIAQHIQDTYLCNYIHQTLLPTYWGLAVALVPRPRPAFCHFQYGKVGRGPGIFSHMSDVRIEKDDRKGLIVRGCTGPRAAKRAKGTT